MGSLIGGLSANKLLFTTGQRFSLIVSTLICFLSSCVSIPAIIYGSDLSGDIILLLGILGNFFGGLGSSLFRVAFILMVGYYSDQLLMFKGMVMIYAT